jgi:hypothetical protein
VQRVAPGILGAGQIVGHGLHFEDMQPAEFGDLFKVSAVLSTSHEAVACGISGYVGWLLTAWSSCFPVPSLRDKAWAKGPKSARKQ